MTEPTSPIDDPGQSYCLTTPLDLQRCPSDSIIVVIIVVAVLWFVARIIVFCLSLARGAGSTFNVSAFSAIVARSRNTPQSGATETTQLNAGGWDLRQFGVAVTVPSHLIGEYNYVCDCLRCTSIDRKPVDLFKIYYKSVWIHAVTVLEFFSIIALLIGLNTASMLNNAGFIIVAAFWTLVYLYVNIHMLWNASRDYWYWTINFPGVSDYTGTTNTFFEVTRAELDAAGYHSPNVEAVGVNFVALSAKMMFYEDRWMKVHNYLPQLLAFHRFLLYAVSLMFFSVSKLYTFYVLQVAVYNLIGIYIVIRIIWCKCCDR